MGKNEIEGRKKERKKARRKKERMIERKNRQKERKEGKKEGRKKERKKEEGRKEERKEERKEKKEGRKGRKKERKKGRKEERKKERKKEGRKERSSEIMNESKRKRGALDTSFVIKTLAYFILRSSSFFSSTQIILLSSRAQTDRTKSNDLKTRKNNFPKLFLLPRDPPDKKSRKKNCLPNGGSQTEGGRITFFPAFIHCPRMSKFSPKPHSNYDACHT